MTVSIGFRLLVEGIAGVTGGLDQVGRKMGDLDERTLKVGNAFKALGATMAGALSIGAIGSWIKSAVDAADETFNLSQKVGIAARDLGGLQLAFKQTGVESGAMQKALVTLSKNVVDGDEAFGKLGVSVKNADGSLKSSKQVLYDVADVFQEMPDGIEKTAYATQIFGKAGADLIPMLNGGSEGLREMASMAEKLGLVIDDEAAASADQFNDTLELLGLGMQGVGRQVAAQLLPTMTNLAASFLETMTQGDALQRVADVIAAALKGLYSVAVGLIEAFGTVGKVFGGVAAAAVMAVQGDFAGAKQALTEMKTDITDGWSRSGQAISKVWSDTGDNTVAQAAKVVGASGRVKDASAELTAEQAKAQKQAEDLATAGAKVAQSLLAQDTGLSGDFREKFDKLTAAYKAGRISLDDYRAASEQLVSQQPYYKEAHKAQEAALKEEETARRNAQKAAEDYFRAIDAQLGTLEQEISLGRELTRTELEMMKVEEDLRLGKKLLTDEELANLRAKLAQRDALNEQIDTLKRAEKATQEAAVARVKQTEAVADATTKIREDIDAQRNANETMRTGKDRTDELAVAKLREAAASADRQAIIAMERLEDETLADQFRDQARALRELADEKEKGVHLKTAQEAAAAWKKTSEEITQGLTDALMRGFESGKGFVENLVDYVRNRFKTMVAEYIVKPLMEPLGQAIASMMSPVRDAISGIMSGISGQIGSYISQLTGLSLNFAGSAASAAASSAGGSAAGSTLSSAVGNAIGSAVLGSSAAYGAAIGTTSIGAGSQAAMLASQTGVFGAAGLSATAGAASTAGSAAAGSAAAGSGVSSFLSAAAPWAAAALAAYMIYKSVDRSGTPHMGASVAADLSGTSRTDGRGLGFEVTPDDRMAAMLSSLAGDIASDLNARRAAAGKPRDVAVELGFADDSSRDGAWGQFRLMVGGRTFAYWGSGDRWPGQGLANGDAGWQQFMQLIGATVASVFDAQMNPRDATVALPEGGGSADSGTGPRQGEQPLREVIGLSGVTRQVDDEGFVWTENGRMRGPGGGLLRLVGNEVYDGDSLFGNVVNGRIVRAFALGGAFTNGIVTEPTAFPFGLMGEAGPEAIMPLTRGPDGALGVAAHGGPGSVFTELLNEMTRMNAALRAVAENTGKTQRLMQRVTRDGESMQVLDVTPA